MLGCPWVCRQKGVSAGEIAATSQPYIALPVGIIATFAARAAYRGAELRFRPSGLAPYRLSPRRIRYLADGDAVSGFVTCAHECSSREVLVIPLDTPSPYGAAWKHPPNMQAAPPSFSDCA